MTDDGKPDITDDQKEQILSMLQQVISADMWLVVALAPHFPQERLGEVVEGLVREQWTIGEQIMPTILDPEQVAKHPLLHIDIEHIETGQRAKFPAYKRLDYENVADDPQLAIATAMAMAFLQSPVVRFLLKAYGFDFSFKQSNDPVKPQLVTQ